MLEESRDLHGDAMQRAATTLPELAEIGRTRRAEVDTAEVARFDMARRGVLAGLGQGAARSLLGGGLFGLLAGIVAAPARADTALDVQIVQTASSLEALAVATYGAVLGQGPEQLEAPAYKAVAGITVQSARDALTAFAAETLRQHAEHRNAFQAQTTALDPGAKVQDAPNPKFLTMVGRAEMSTPEKLVEVAALLEKVATDTYLTNLSLLQDSRTKALMAGVMAVEAQHLAHLRTVGALLRGGTPQLLAVPFPAGRMKDLPHTTGRIAFPDALHQVGEPELLADPASGAAP